MSKMRAYAYTRVSTTMQVDGYSLEAQRNEIQQYCNNNNIEVIGWYSDEGKSGKSIEGRQEFQLMLKDIKINGNIDYVVCFKLSRFGRSTIDTLNSLNELEKSNCGLLAVKDGIDSKREMGKFFITVLGMIAEMERENIATQTMAGRKQKAHNGRWNGGFAPYGYDLVEGQLIINKEDAELIKLIFDKFANTPLGYNGVATYCNKIGLEKRIRPNTNSGDITPEFVKKVLDNIVYCGKIAYGRRKNVFKSDGTTTTQSQKEYIIADGIHEPIISEELFYKAKRKRENTAIQFTRKYGLQHQHLLSQILRCPNCGGPMDGRVKRYNGKNKTSDYFEYYCRQSNKCPKHVVVAQSYIDDELKSILQSLSFDKNFESAVMQKLYLDSDLKKLEAEYNAAKVKRKSIEKSIEQLSNQLDNLVYDSAYEIKYDNLNKRLNKQMNVLVDAEHDVEIAYQNLSKLKDEHLNAAQVVELIRDMSLLIPKMDEKELREFFKIIIKEINFNNEVKMRPKITHIKFNFPMEIEGENLVGKKLTVETVVLISRVGK